MTKSLQIVIVLVTVFIAGVVHAAPDQNQNRAEKIRTEYRGDTTPDHIMFGFTLLSMKKTQEQNPDIATQLIQVHMKLDPEDDAHEFLSRMIAAATTLEKDWATVKDEMLCGQNAPRQKDIMYQRLDQVDDVRETKSQIAYNKFMSGLDESQQAAMTAWLREEKEGFYYRTAEHESMYENTDYDVVGHVDMNCAKRRNKR